MIAVILAAGMAKRLRPLTTNTPKCLLKVGNKTLLQRTIDALKSVGVDTFVIVTGFLGYEIENFVAQYYPNEHFVFVHNSQFETTNNIYSLWLAKQHVYKKEFLLLDSDILFDPQLLTALMCDKCSTLAVSVHPLGDEEMKVVVDKEGKIVQITKLCNPDDAMGESVGIEKMSAPYSKMLFDELDTMIEDEQKTDVFYEMAFERLIEKGYSFSVVNTTQWFSTELDTVDDFEHAQELIPAHLF